MKTKLILPIISLIGLSATAQVLNVYPNIDWVRNYSEKAAISNVPSAIDAGSNVYVTGYTYPSSPSNADLTTIKYDATGILMWVRHYDNGGYDDANAITLDSPGNIYVTGESAGVGTSKDIITIKYDATGTQLWASRYNGAINGNDVANAIITDPSGNVYVTGKTDVMGGTANYITIKYNSAGVQQWVHTYNGTGNNNDNSVAVDYSSTGRLFITGTSQNLAGNSDIVTIRINPTTGAQMWVKTINGSANTNDIAFSILADGNNVVTVGSQNNTTTGDDYVTLKYNGNTGSTLWQKNYDNSNQINVATSLVKDASNNYVVTGTHYNGAIYEYHTIMYNNTGVQQWVNVNATNISFSSVTPKIAVDPIANHFYVCGEKKVTNNDILVYQITPGGNKSWEETFNGAMNAQDAAVDLVVNSAGIVYVAGASLNSSAKFDYTTIRISQTPYYNVPDLLNEPTSRSFSYYTNSGQLRDETGASAKDALFYSHNQNPEVFVEKNAYNYVFQSIDTSSVTLDTIEKIKVSFLNSNRFSKSYANTSKTYPINYFLGHVGYPITDVVGYDRLYTPNIYPNIDLHYYSNAKGLKYYFVVKPGADVNNIKLVINGASSTFINSSNNLVLNGTLGDVELKQPLAYQVNMLGASIPLIGASTFTNVGTNVYGVKPTTYNPSLPLIIVFANAAVPTSPSGTTANLDYSTYFGGNTTDQLLDIKVATNGDRVISGLSAGGTFPNVNGLGTSFLSGNIYDAVIIKYLGNDSLKFATYYGGNGAEFGNSIALNSTGDIFVGGETQSTNLLTTLNAGQTNQPSNGYFTNTSLGLKSDGLLLKLSKNGNVMQYARYVGGSKSERINSIYIDANDNLYVAGYSSSTNFPVVSPSKGSLGASANPDNFDCIVGKFNSSQLATWITYYGGNNNGVAGTYTQDDARDIIADNAGNVFICGTTDAYDFPVVNPFTSNPNVLYNSTLNGSTYDGFIARFSSSGVPNYATYVGGNGSDRLTRLVYKANTNELYFAGDGGSTTGFPFKFKSGAYNSTYTIARQSFLGYMNSSLEHQWITNYGHGTSKYYNVLGFSVDNTGSIYMSGTTNSDTLTYASSIPVGSYVDNSLSSTDGFLAIFGTAKQLKHAHYFGGSSTESINNSDLLGDNTLYVVGQTKSNNFPIAYNTITASLIDSTYNGTSDDDGFISRFDITQYNVVGVSEIKNNSAGLSVYPNPATQSFNIKLETDLNEKITITVYNSIGQMVHAETMANALQTINCSLWSTGIYIVSVKSKSINSSFKIIKD